MSKDLTPAQLKRHQRREQTRKRLLDTYEKSSTQAIVVGAILTEIDAVAADHENAIDERMEAYGEPVRVLATKRLEAEILFWNALRRFAEGAGQLITSIYGRGMIFLLGFVLAARLSGIPITEAVLHRALSVYMTIVGAPVSGVLGTEMPATPGAPGATSSGGATTDAEGASPREATLPAGTPPAIKNPATPEPP